MMQAQRSLRTISTLARHSARATPFIGSRFPYCSRLKVNLFGGWTGESLPLAQSSAGQHRVLAAAPQACVQQTHRRQRCAGARHLPSAPGIHRPCHGTVCGGASAQAPPAPAPPTAGADSAMRGSSQRHVSRSCTWYRHLHLADFSTPYAAGHVSCRSLQHALRIVSPPRMWHAPADEHAESATEAILLDVDGMKCGSCSAAVKRLLAARPEVHSAAVNLVTGSAVVSVRSPAAPALPSQLGELLTAKVRRTTSLLGPDPGMDSV